MKNPEVIDLQPYLLRNRAKAIEIKEIPELVKVKKKRKSFFEDSNNYNLSHCYRLPNKRYFN